MLHRDEHELGAVRLECRPLTPFQSCVATRGRANAIVWFFVQIPYLVLLIGLLLTGVMLVVAIRVLHVMPEKLDAAAAGWFFAVAMSAICLPLFFLAYGYPYIRKRRLTVHEGGISGTRPSAWGPFRPFAVRFDDIDHLRIGKKMSGLQQHVAKVASIENPGTFDWHQWLLANVVTICLRSEGAIPLSNLYSWYHADDVEAFVTLIGQKVPVDAVQPV